MVGRHVGIGRRHLVENLAEEREGLQNIGLVNTGDLGTRWFAPTACQVKRGADHALGPAPGDHLGIDGNLVAHLDARAQRGKEALGALSDDHEINRRLAGKCCRNALPAAGGADAGVKVEHAPERDLRRQLGAIGFPHIGPAARSQENGVGLPASRQRRIGKIGAAFEKRRGTGGGIQEARARIRPTVERPRS